MDQRFIFIAFKLLISLSFTQSVTVKCIYHDNGNWWVIKNFYYCNSDSHLDIVSPETATIDSITGKHLANRTFDDVEGFEADNLTIHYFPRGLEKIFKNLKMIDINNGRLKEVHQADLKPFPKLKCLELYENDIEVLEEGLFDYNPDLEMIWLSSNKIFHVDVNVFDHLGKLTYLSLDTNRCISEYAENNATEVAKVVKYSKKNCQDMLYLRKLYPVFMKKFDKIQSDLDELKQLEHATKEKLIDVHIDQKKTWQTLFWIIFGILIGIAGFIVIKKLYPGNAGSKARVVFENRQYPRIMDSA